MHLNGEGPSKSDYVVTCWFLSAANWACDGEPGGEFMKKTTITIPSKGTVVKVAFPELHIQRAGQPQRRRIDHRAATAARAPWRCPSAHIAVKTMADKMHRIFRDAIIRVITKTLSSKAAGRRRRTRLGGGKLLGWAGREGHQRGDAGHEEADKRAWTTLPSRIDVARVMVPPAPTTSALRLPRGGRPDDPGRQGGGGQAGGGDLSHDPLSRRPNE